jgi:hypothetical protein
MTSNDTKKKNERFTAKQKAEVGLGIGRHFVE